MPFLIKSYYHLMAMNTKIASTAFAVIAIAAALTFLALNISLNSFFHLAIAANDVGNLNALTTGSGFDTSPNPGSNANFATPGAGFNANSASTGSGIQAQFDLCQAKRR